MPRVVADITMSLDGFVTGPNAGPDSGLGEGGEPLHDWVSAPTSVRLPFDFTFVTDGLASAVEQARAAAGSKDVYVMGGADVIRQCVETGLADELRIHLAAVVLGAGTPLFGGGIRRILRQESVRVSRVATHLTYAVNAESRDGDS